MPRPSRWLVLLFATLVLLVWLAPAASGVRVRVSRATIQEQLKQCHSGGTNVAASLRGRGPCIYESPGAFTGWAHGNINASNSLYRAGDFVPFRLAITGLTAGSVHTLKLAYTAVRNAGGRGVHGYDYLGSYDASEVPYGLLEKVVPCGGIGDTAGFPCGANPSMLAIPKDTPNVPTGNPGTTFPIPSLPGGIGAQKAGEFAAWGATLEAGSAHYVDCGTTCSRPVLQPMPDNNAVDRVIQFKFKADGPTAVLAWSAHIATPLDWGFGNTYADAGSGSAGFHMSIDLVGVTGGSRDEDMNVSAIAPTELVSPGLITQVRNPGTPAFPVSPVPVGQTVRDTVTIVGGSGFPPYGKVHFFVCRAATENPDCRTGGTEIADSPDTIETHGTAGIAFARADFTPNLPGHYCFRVEYVPGNEAPYSPAQHTNTITSTGPGTAGAQGECFEARAVPIQLTVTKECSPEGDTGSFNILVDGQPVGTVGCEQTVGPFDVTAGEHVVTETAATGTDLNNYVVRFGGDCNDLGQVTVSTTDRNKTCVITNARKPPAEGDLTVTKACVPTTDSGRFEIQVDGKPVADLSCGEATAAPVGLAPGPHTLSEAGVPPTSSSDYTSVISCNGATGGSITIVAGETLSCTVTNTRIPPPTTLEVEKLCVPTNDPARFNLTINGTVAGTGANVACGGTTGAVNVSPGAHTVGETAANGTSLGDYTSVIEGDCAANGAITVAAGRQAICTITNVRSPLKPPPPPAEVCYTLTVKPKTVRVGRRARVRALVHTDGRPAIGVRVYLRGPRISAVGTTALNGRVTFTLKPRRRGILHVKINKAFLCPSHPPRRVGILGVKTPPITG